MNRNLPCFACMAEQPWNEQTLFLLGETKPEDVVQPSVDVSIHLVWIAGPQHQFFKSASIGLHQRKHQRFPAVCFNFSMKKHNLTILQGCLFFFGEHLQFFLKAVSPCTKLAVHYFS